MKPQGYVPPSASPSAHEGADLHIPIVLRAAAILAVTLVASLLILALFFRHLERAYPARTSEAAPRVTDADLPPAPRLQTTPLLDLQAVRATEDAHLNRYAWIDPTHGVARIPIDRAMILWVKTDAAAPPATPALAPAPTELQMRQQKAEETPHAP
jgi:hypothetical protein